MLKLTWLCRKILLHDHQLFILLLGFALTDYFIENDVLKPKMFKTHRRGRGGTLRKISH